MGTQPLPTVPWPLSSKDIEPSQEIAGWLAIMLSINEQVTAPADAIPSKLRLKGTDLPLGPGQKCKAIVTRFQNTAGDMGLGITPLQRSAIFPVHTAQFPSSICICDKARCHPLRPRST